MILCDLFVTHNHLKSSKFSIMNDSMNNIVNDKKSHNIMNDKTTDLLLSQTAYLLKRQMNN